MSLPAYLRIIHGCIATLAIVYFYVLYLCTSFVTLHERRIFLFAIRIISLA